MVEASSRRVLAGLLVGLGVVALAVAVELIRPFAAGAVGFDSAASVIHFERIVSGRSLEAFVTATPKPLLTALYGLLMAGFDDWRAVAIAGAAAFAGCVVLGTWFAGRVAGPVAAVVAAVGLLGSRSLLADVTIAYAVPWAVLLWLVAGLALTADRPRPLLAGLALAGATLARLETIVLLGLLAVALPAAWAVRRRTADPLPRRWWLLLTAWLALPAMLVHDLLLTGDPWFWVSVSARFSAAAPDAVLGPIELGRVLVTRYVGMALLSGLAVVGLVVLGRRRAVVPLLGLAGLTLGIGGFLIALAARGTYVSSRYPQAIDVALIVAAAVGLTALLALAATRRRAREARAGRGASGASGASGATIATIATPMTVGARVAVGAVAVIVAIAAIWPVASLNASFRSSARAQRLQAEHADRVLPVLRCAVAAIPGAGTVPDPDAALIDAGRDEVVVLVPALARPRLARDLDLPLFEVGGLPVAWADPSDDFLPHGGVVFHDRLGNRPPEAFAALEVTTTTTIADVTLTPLVADPAAGIWVLAVSRDGDGVDLAGCAEAP